MVADELVGRDETMRRGQPERRPIVVTSTVRSRAVDSRVLAVDALEDEFEAIE